MLGHSQGQRCRLNPEVAEFHNSGRRTGALKDTLWGAKHISEVSWVDKSDWMVTGRCFCWVHWESSVRATE